MTTHMWLTIAVIFAVTYTLRGSAFLVRAKSSDTGIIADLGKLMPVGVMVILVIYSVTTVWDRSVIAVLVALAVTIGLHLWKSSTLLSIIGGVACYGALIYLLT